MSRSARLRHKAKEEINSSTFEEQIKEAIVRAKGIDYACNDQGDEIGFDTFNVDEAFSYVMEVVNAKIKELHESAVASDSYTVDVIALLELDDPTTEILWANKDLKKKIKELEALLIKCEERKK